MPESQKQHSPDNEEFKFVAESNRKTLRSHAMRAHWRQRKQWTGGQRGGGNGTQRHLRPLLPHRRARRDCSLATHHAENGQDTNTCALASSNQLPTKGELAGEASRALYRMIGTVACGRLDPFDRLPITLTVEHQELLHHCMFVECRIHLGAACHPHTGPRGFHVHDNDVWPSASCHRQSNARRVAAA